MSPGELGIHRSDRCRSLNRLERGDCRRNISRALRFSSDAQKAVNGSVVFLAGQGPGAISCSEIRQTRTEILRAMPSVHFFPGRRSQLIVR